MFRSCLFLVGLILFRPVSAQNDPLFISVPPKKSGINFKNSLLESPTSNVLTYEYFYNGGGVAVGDFNNDGLEDIYFTANMGKNKLFINEGNLIFKDVTSRAGVACDQGWKTGVTLADVNADGWLDIYVCFSGKGSPDQRRNRLFINNGDLTFTDRAKDYGVDDPGYTTHASFFDYDRDGDLDLYVLNHNVVVIREFEFAKAKDTRHPFAGDRLYRNDAGRFTDVSAAAGIKGNPLGFGLGVSVADINQDGWPDIYVSNDYIEPDYVYINNRDGTFTDRLSEYMQHISYFSMGCDVSDFNNDGWPDIFTLDMLPEDNQRQKLLYGPDNYEHFALMVLNGFYFQNMRNMLHLNNRNGTYSEIGQLAGISNTDWSWATLFADYDNDGWKDLFITNGYYRDYTNRDFLKYKGDYYFEKGRAKEPADTFHLVTTMTSTPVHNYMFRNQGDLTFADKSKAWGFAEPVFSNGAAYADFDNDGDLDLVINNQNATASLWRNQLRETKPEQHFLQILLQGNAPNRQGIGAKTRIYAGGQIQYFEMIATRGFQSAVSNRIHVGLGTVQQVDSISVTWNNGQQTVLYNVPADQRLTITEQTSTTAKPLIPNKHHTYFTQVTSPLPFTHTEQGFNDFKRQPLLVTMYSNCGPVMAIGDVNKDGLEDILVGGAEGSPAKMLLQSVDGTFTPALSFNPSAEFTDAAALLVDLDQDQDLDIYLVSGGYNNYEQGDKFLEDRVYLNDGKARFTPLSTGMPSMPTSKSCIAAGDVDNDGDLDLFLGGRVIPGNYPYPPDSYLLINQGGKFTPVPPAFAPDLLNIGMVTDARWLDLNKDGWMDLVVIGEFMAIEVFHNREGKKMERATATFFDRPIYGLWTKMVVHDFDQDGDEDFIIGNFGRNTQLKASVEEPLTLYYKDFDRNGSVDPILCNYVRGVSYPFAGRDELLDQMVSMRSKFTSYAAYADARLENLFSAADLRGAPELKVTELNSIYLENIQGKLIPRDLPVQFQFAPVYAMTLVDINRDGHMDVVAAGNQSSIRIRLGVMDANFGQAFINDGRGQFSYVPQPESGLNITGDTRSLQMLTIDRKNYLIAGVNNVGVTVYRLN